MNKKGHLSPWTMIGRTPPKTCPECACKHDPSQPRNLQSLTYQYKFYDKYGRWPTWTDAMEHCSEEVKVFWIDGLKNLGIEV
jgi:hypothetical protein